VVAGLFSCADAFLTCLPSARRLRPLARREGRCWGWSLSLAIAPRHRRCWVVGCPSPRPSPRKNGARGKWVRGSFKFCVPARRGSGEPGSSGVACWLVLLIHRGRLRINGGAVFRGRGMEGCSLGWGISRFAFFLDSSIHAMRESAHDDLRDLGFESYWR